MKFSLINVQRREGLTVAGTWLQNHIGTLETATQRAAAIAAVNSNKITVAVVDELATSTPILGFYTGLTPLNGLDNPNKCANV